MSSHHAGLVASSPRSTLRSLTALHVGEWSESFVTETALCPRARPVTNSQPLDWMMQ